MKDNRIERKFKNMYFLKVKISFFFNCWPVFGLLVPKGLRETLPKIAR